MAKQFDDLRAISPIHENWSAKVRVIRLWNVPPYSKDGNSESEGSIDMVLCDRDVSYIFLFSFCIVLLLYTPIIF